MPGVTPPWLDLQLAKSVRGRLRTPLWNAPGIQAIERETSLAHMLRGREIARHGERKNIAGQRVRRAGASTADHRRIDEYTIVVGGRVLQTGR